MPLKLTLFATLLTTVASQGGTVLSPTPKFSTCVAPGTTYEELWIVQSDSDMKDWGDGDSTAPVHPKWNSTATSACECARLTGGEGEGRYVFFVWDSNTKKCYPKRLPISQRPADVIQKSGHRFTSGSVSGVVGSGNGSMQIKSVGASITTTDPIEYQKQCREKCLMAGNECDMYTATCNYQRSCNLVKLRRVSGVYFGFKQF